MSGSSLLDDEPAKQVRNGADWENHRRHRSPQSGPPQDEVGVLALSSLLLARTEEVVVTVRGITTYSDGLHLSVVVPACSSPVWGEPSPGLIL